MATRRTKRLTIPGCRWAWFTVILLIAGCPADTCSPGANMTDPRLLGGLESAGDLYQVRIGWDPGSGAGGGLPDAYFAAVNLGESAGVPIAQTDLVQSVRLSSPRELAVVFQPGITPASLANAGQVSFRLYFPDRREFIECTHPGDADRYYLDVVLELDADGLVRTATLIEGRQLGEI